MKRILTLALAALLLAGCGAVQPGYAQISPEEARARMEAESGYLLIDVRTQEEYESGHIPGARCIPNESIGSRQPEGLPDLDQTIFVYCRSGNRSKQASEKLAKLGYTHVVEFGGIIDWPGEIVTGAEAG